MHRSSVVLFAFCATCGCSANEGVPGTSPGGSGGAAAGASSTSGSGGVPNQGGSTQSAGAAGAAALGGGGASGSLGGSAGSSGSAGSAGSAGAGGGGPDVAFCSTALDAAALQLAGFRTAYPSATNVPRSAKGGIVDMVDLGDWTSGFPGGSYWLMYEHTNDQAFKTSAEAFTAAMESLKTDGSSHDLGFQFMSTFGQGLRIAKTASYLSVLQTAATTLTTRFRPAVGSIESWDHGTWDCPVIIDNMMNLHLLYFVSKNGGTANMAEIATKHADTAITNHYRPDNSSFHLVNYNTSTGAIIGKQTVQGFANDSAWARGQAWGLYGYTESYVSTQKAEYLIHAQKIAEFLLSHPNMPEDKVPYWDFDAPQTEAPTPRDASAAAVMASALLQLAKVVEEPAASKYRDYALSQLASLASPAYAAATGSNSHFLLMHSTGHLPNGIEIDAAINYADYYYLEALLACRALAAPSAANQALPQD